GQFDTGTGLPEEPDGVSDYTLLASCGAVGVLEGSVITYPALHRAGGQRDTIRPLTDLSLNSATDGGTPRTLELDSPRDLVGVAERQQVVLQYCGTSSQDLDNEAGWRQTAVPTSPRASNHEEGWTEPPVCSGPDSMGSGRGERRADHC